VEIFRKPVGHVGIRGDTLLIIIPSRAVPIANFRQVVGVRTTIGPHYNLLFDAAGGEIGKACRAKFSR